MTRRTPRWLGAAFCVAVAATAAPSLSCSRAAPRCVLSHPDARVAPLLWRVHAQSGAAIWLFGTIHDAGSDDVPGAAWRELEGAASFVSELGDDEPDPRQFRELARLPWGQVLDRQLPTDDWFELVTALAGVMQEDELRHARPWFALIRLRAYVIHAPKPSMDTALAERARRQGIAIGRLESWDQQLAALDTSITASDLANVIHDRSALACDVAVLISAYRTGDVAALTHLLVDPVQGTALLAERNRRWLPRIERLLAPGTAGAGGRTFIAVGLGHLLGDAGLLATLERAGYAVERAQAH